MRTFSPHASRFYLLAAVSVVVSTAACSSEPGAEGSLGTARQAVWGGFDDPNTLEANVVVNISGCSGTLITPRVVLTAAHCLHEGFAQTVYFGNDFNAYSAQVNSERVATHPGYNQGVEGAPHPTELDVGLVFLERPIFNKGKIHRPSLQTPENPNVGGVGLSGWSKCGRNLDTYDFTNSKRQAAIWQDGVFDGPAGLAPLNLERAVSETGSMWQRPGTDVGVCFGDSGGALFTVHPDGTREVFGVTSAVGYDGVTRDASWAYWADITSEQVRSWVLANVLDSANGGHSPEWLAAHGKDPSTFWYGEADYTGTCDTARDPDCDYWYSEHDENPNEYDPEHGGPPTSPCDGLCANPVAITSQWYSSGQLGSNATCHESHQPMTGFQCGNLSSSRSLSINGQTVACGQNVAIPAQRAGGYCVQTTAGQYDWAYFVTW